MIVSVQFKRSFFDRALVQREVDPKLRAGMNRFGGYVRRTARSSIKRRGAARPAPKNRSGKAYQVWLAEQASRPRSSPGSAPFQHTAHPVVNPKNIQYAWDGKASVIIGMVGLRRGRGRPVPHEIEFGSTQLTYNPRARVRKIGDGGEVEIGRKVGGTTKVAYRTRLGDVAVSYALLRTEPQVALANQINRQLYGEPTQSTKTEPRPVITPAFGLGVTKFREAFSGLLQGGG